MAVNRVYATELVDCPRCDGTGRIEWDDDGPMTVARCSYCHGTGDIEVCAQCHDSGDDCGACGA